jgi:hypothetical protein
MVLMSENLPHPLLSPAPRRAGEAEYEKLYFILVLIIKYLFKN